MIKFNRSLSTDIFNLSKVKQNKDSSNLNAKSLENLSTCDKKISRPNSVTSSKSSSSSTNSEIMVLNLETLGEGQNLEKWLEGLRSKGALIEDAKLDGIKELINQFLGKDVKADVPNAKNAPNQKDVLKKDLERLKEEAKTRYQSIKGLEAKKGARFDGKMPLKLLNQFKELSPAKQALIVVGITVSVAAIGFLSWNLISLMWPSFLVLSQTGYATEVLLEFMKQRHESGFHLLSHHAANAKPLSYAWTNQYILWRYI